MNEPQGPHAAPTGPSRRGLLIGGGASTLTGMLGRIGLAGAATTAAVTASALPAHAADAYDTLRAAWLSQLAATTISSSDSTYSAARAASDSSAQSYYTTLNTASSRTALWSDAPVGTVSANVTTCFKRIFAIAVNWATPGCAYHQSAQVATDLVSALDWLNANAYNTSVAEYNNWWDWEIGSPQSLLNSMTILYPNLSATQISTWLAAVDHFDPDPTKQSKGTLVSTGANRVDLCQVAIVRGILGKLGSKISAGQTALSPAFLTTLVGDGLHPDGSFVQHNGVAYTGTYGIVWFGGVAKLVALLAGSAWAITDPNLANVYGAVTSAIAPVVHNGLMLDSVRGRAQSRVTERDADDGLLAALGILLLTPSASASQQAVFKPLVKGMLQRNTVRPVQTWAPLIPSITSAVALLNDSSVTAAAEPVSSVVLPDMDRVVHRRPGWAYALSLSSSRIERFEETNGENLHGWHTGDGMGQLYLDSDITQFDDEFWETVNPYRLPGITVDSTQGLADSAGTGTYTGRPRVGGAILAGTYAAVAMDFQAYSATLTGKKSWFCLDDCVVALGAGITSGDGRVIESIVEARNLGDPSTTTDPALTVNGTTVADKLGTVQTFSGASYASLAGVGGYVFPGGTAIKTLREDRSGSWTDVNALSATSPRFPSLGPFTRRYQQIWFDHGASPTNAAYSYILLPNFTAAQTAARAAAPTVTVLANTAAAQAVTSSRLGLTAANFFTAGTAGPITVSAPCSVLVQERNSTMTVAVADPGRAAATVTVTVATGTSYVSAQPDSGVSVLSVGGGRVQLLVEVGGARGGTRSVTLTTDSGHPVNPATVTAVRPSADSYVRDGASYADVNYGTATTLVVKNAGGSAGYDRKSYFTFPLSGLGTVSRAVLWVYGTTSDSAGNQQNLTAYQVPNTTWTETGITWNNAPTLGGALGSAPVTSDGGWAPLDVTSFVAAQASAGAVSLAVWEASGGLACVINSRENPADPPFLQIVSQ